MERYGTLWSPMGLYGAAVWGAMGRYGAQVHPGGAAVLVRAGLVHDGQQVAQRELWGSAMGHYRHNGALWSSMGCYGALRDSMELYGALWDSVELYGGLWDSIEHNGALWGSMGRRYGAL